MYTHIEALLEKDHSEIVEKVFTFIDETYSDPESSKRELDEIFWDENNIPYDICFERLSNNLDDIDGFEDWLSENVGTNNYTFDRE